MYSSLIDRKGHLRDKGDSNNHDLDNTCKIILFSGRHFFIQPDDLFFTLQQIEPVKACLSEPIYLGEYEKINYYGFYTIKENQFFDTLNQQGLKDISTGLIDFESALLFYCQGLLLWHIRHPFCSRCGSQTRVTQSGHARRCVNLDCNTQLFPKVEPAVIFLVLNQQMQETRLLLARQESWEDKRFSLLAGFVETGESLEDAVKREAYEEAGIIVENPEYISSQPWPFPSSLMIGYQCVTSETETNLIDQELSEAYWFSAREIETKVKSQLLKLPHKKSIAWSLINTWFNQQMGYSLDDISQ
jgi:NAD+ diphosphatase